MGGGIANLGAGLGAGIGGMLTRRRRKEELQQAQQTINKYTTAGSINPGMLLQNAQQAEAENNPQLAQMYRQGAEQAQQNLVTGQNLTAYNQLAAKAGLSPEEAAPGVRGLALGQYTNPSSALKGTVETQKMVEKKANTQYVVNQLKAEGLESVATDIERGLYTDAQVGTVLANARQAQAAARQGQEALEAYVTASDLSGTSFGEAVVQGNLKGVPSNLVSQMATEAINERRTTKLIVSLKSMNTDVSREAAELLEMGVITDEGAKKLVVEEKKGPQISTSNMKQYVLEDGTVVWGGDITVDGDERKAYRDPQNPNSIINLPVEAVELKGEARIRGEDLRLAGIQLAENPKFSDLDAIDQEKAKVAFASKYNELITKKKTNEEALAEAKAHALSLIEQKTEEGFKFMGFEVPLTGKTTTEFKGPMEFDSVEAAEAAGLKPDTIVFINGRRAIIEKKAQQ
jgi:hypothetical protein